MAPALANEEGPASLFVVVIVGALVFVGTWEGCGSKKAHANHLQLAFCSEHSLCGVLPSRVKKRGRTKGGRLRG